MARASPGFNSFAGGELSPLLEGRQDVAKFSIGCRRLENFFPLVQGPARKRGGTRFVAEVKTSANRTWLYPFIKSESDAVVIEWGDLCTRFHAGRGPILSAGVPYEVVSPYAVGDLVNSVGAFGLSIAQSADVLYLANASYAPRKLSRTSNTSWAYSTYAPTDGPFEPQNIDKTISVTVGAATGTGVTLTNDAANIPVPYPTVGRLFRLEETDKSAVSPWEPNKQIAIEGGVTPTNQQRRSDGHLYNCETTGTVGVGGVEWRTGTVKPVHTEGTYADGDKKPITSGATVFAEKAGIDWKYKHSGYGIGNITAVAVGGLTATIDLQDTWPDSTVAPGSYRWSLGSWYAGHYPATVTFFRDRLTWSSGERVWLSASGSYDSMAIDTFGQTLADNAIDVNIAVGNADQIAWMIGTREALLIGTGGGELALKEITAAQVFGPANAKFDPQTFYGSRAIAPVSIGNCTLFVEAGGRILREAQYSVDVSQYVAADLTAYSEHITLSGLTDLDYAKNPHSLVWCLRSDGKLACLTYQRDESMLAWSLHDVGGVVESIAVIPGPDAGIDDLYMIVRRSINGATKRYVEVLMPPYTAPNDPHLSTYQDCSLTYDGRKATTLAIGAGYGTVGAVATFTAGAAMFAAGDVAAEKEIRVRYYDADAERWFTAIAVITGYTSTTVVAGTIVAAFPSNSYASLGWGLTATVLTGANHLEAETVRITADGATHVDRVVSGGSVTLTRQTLVAHVGKAVRGIVQTMNIEAGASDGTAQGKKKRIHECTFRVLDTLGGSFGPDLTNLKPIQYRQPSNLMSESVPLYTGDLSVVWHGGHETEGRVTFVHDEGLPCTLVAIYPQLTTEDHKTGSRR